MDNSQELGTLLGFWARPLWVNVTSDLFPFSLAYLLRYTIKKSPICCSIKSTRKTSKWLTTDCAGNHTIFSRSQWMLCKETTLRERSHFIILCREMKIFSAHTISWRRIGKPVCRLKCRRGTLLFLLSIYHNFMTLVGVILTYGASFLGCNEMR